MKLRKLRLRPKMVCGSPFTNKFSGEEYCLFSQRAKRWEDRNKLKK